MRRMIVAGAIGGLLGLIGSRILFVGSFLSLVPWGLIGLASGIYAKTRKDAIVTGAVYGFLLTFIFMVTGYNGRDALATKILLFAVFGVFGAFCGTVLGIAGYFIRVNLKSKKI